MTEPGDYTVLYGDNSDAISVLVPRHNEVTQLTALMLMLDHECFYDLDNAPREAVQAELSEMRAVWLSRHVSGDPEERDCGCEDETWWCPEGGGPRSAAWITDRTRIVSFAEEHQGD